MLPPAPAKCASNCATKTGKPIGGFSTLECKPLTGDGVAIPVGWRDGNNLQKLAGKPLRIAFRLRDASLYGYQFR